MLLSDIDEELHIWRKWRVSDRYDGLGFPPVSAEQKTPGERSTALPHWGREMKVEGLVQIYREHDLKSFVCSMAILGVNDLLPEVRKDLNFESPEAKARIISRVYHIKVGKSCMYQRFNNFKVWLSMHY